MSSYKIIGGKPLRGTIIPLPNKNSILKIIPACVLCDEPVLLHNVPKSSSVRAMLRIFSDLGGKVSYRKGNIIQLNSYSIKKYSIDDKLACRERASLLYLGSLLSRFKKAEIGDSGGCMLGNRPLDSMFKGLESLGVKIDNDKGYKMMTNGLKGNSNIWLLEASVTGTETLIIASVKAKGTTIIYNAACEPHTQDLCNFLVACGAKISGIGTNRLVIQGVDYLKGTNWSIIPDHLDIGGLIIAAVLTKGELLIKNAIPDHMTQILNYFSKFNVKVVIKNKDIFVPSNQNLKCKHNIKGDIDKIPDQPWPGFPVDLIPEIVVLGACSKGNMKIYSIMYETQLLFVEQLLRMKAKLDLVNSHEVISFGPSNLIGVTLDAPSILRCAYSLILAGLSAKGETIIKNADIIERGYPDIVKRLISLGANIQKF